MQTYKIVFGLAVLGQKLEYIRRAEYGKLCRREVYLRAVTHGIRKLSKQLIFKFRE